MLAARAVRAEIEREEAGLLRPLEHDRARAVAEEDDGRAVVPVDDAGEHVAADDERSLGETGGEHPVRLYERVHEAGAAGREVIGGSLGRAELVGEDHGARGKGHVRRDRGDDEQVDVLADEARLRERCLAARQREIGERLLVRGDPPLADPCALDDPLVRRVDERLELGVRRGSARARMRPGP